MNRRAMVASILGAAFLAHARRATAHEWFTKRNDPAYNTGCCGGSDCRPIPIDWVREKQGGYQVTMTLEQARTVNPSAMAPVDAFVPYARVQPSEDKEGRFAVCIFANDRSAPRGGVICFFAPATT
jgi:hypothetical protein